MLPTKHRRVTAAAAREDSMPDWRGAGICAPIIWALLASSGAAAPPPPGPLRDWPCEAPFADHLVPQAVWPGELPATLPDADAWQTDPATRRLVLYITSPENSPAAGVQMIEDWSREAGSFQGEVGLRVLTGMVEQTNKMRDILIEGIHTLVLRSHILAEAVANNDADLAAAIKALADGAAHQPDAIRMARFWNLRALDDTGDSAALLCHRYAYDEQKARMLGAAIRAHTK
jgi:hypothetical protein